MSNNIITVCVIHPHQHTQGMLSSYLSKTPGHHCIGVFSSFSEALAKIPAIAPAVVLLDIDNPGITGIDCVSTLKSLCKETQLMVYTACDDEAMVIAALKAGATGYIHSSCSSLKELKGHIRDLHRGGSPISSCIARKLVHWIQQPGVNNQEKYSITKREKEILLLLDKGGSYQSIADSLFISSKTVRKHIYNIYEKLHASSKIEAVNRFFGRG